MHIALRHSPAYTIARVTLDPNESIRVESGAMVARSADVELTSKMEGGLLKSLKRAVMAGDSFFMSTLTAGAGGGWVDLAPGLPGDIIHLPVAPDAPWVLTRSAWLASSNDGSCLELLWCTGYSRSCCWRNNGD